ncbi:MAG: pitrilysin family protein [Porphyromonas sp.]|nr:pitrilysin family protein [Porphyromonas sp.]
MEPYIYRCLDNGLHTALLPVKSNVVYCGFAIRSGSSHDPIELPGLAHFVEHTIFKGTQRRKSWHIINRMEVVGGELNAYTTKDTTFVYTAAPKRELARSVELLNDLIRHATFPDTELEKEKGVVADEINSYKDTPSELIYDHFEELFFEGHPLAHPILGDTESLARMTSEDCRAYVRRAFAPQRMLFFCMGQISELRFEKVTSTFLSEPFVQSGEEIQLPAPTIRHFSLRKATDTYQAHTLIGGIAPSLQEADRTEAGLLLNILAGSGMNSRLNVRLREKEGWVYNVESSYAAIPSAGWWQIYFGSDPEHAGVALEQTLAEVERLCRVPLTPTALRAWKKQAKGQAIMATEQGESLFLNFGRQLLLKGKYEGLKGLTDRIDSVTTEHLQEVAVKLFDLQPISQLIYLGKSV